MESATKGASVPHGAGVKEETQMVPGTKLWKLIHRLDKIKPIYLTIYLLCACLCGPTDLLVCRCRSFHTREGGVCPFVAANWSRALKSPERTEFFGQPVNCAVNTSVCLSLRGSDISESPRLCFYESLDLWCDSDTRLHTGKRQPGCLCGTLGYVYNHEQRGKGTFTETNKKKKVRELEPSMFSMTCESLNSCLSGSSFWIIKINIIRQRRT